MNGFSNMETWQFWNIIQNDISVLAVIEYLSDDLDYLWQYIRDIVWIMKQENCYGFDLDEVNVSEIIDTIMEDIENEE